MTEIVHTIARIRAMAAEAQTPIEQFMATAEVLSKAQNEENDARRSSTDERKAIDAYLHTLNGNISPDLPASEIVANAADHAGIVVRHNRGTSQYAAHQKKLLLTFYKQKAV